MKKLTFFKIWLLNRPLLSLYAMEEEILKIFYFSLANHTFLSLYGVKEEI